MPVIQFRNFLWVLASILAANTPAAAEEPEEAIARCARIATVGDRILCLEDALRASLQAGGPAIPADAVVEESPIPESGLPAAAAAIPVGSADVVEEVMEAAGQSAPTDIVLAPQAEETIPAAVDAVTAAGISDPQQFGLSETQGKPQPLDSVDVVVVAVDRNAYGKLIYRTEGGQVWRQTDNGRPRYRQIPFDAEIRDGAAGSFFIKPLSGGVAVRVKRSK